MWPRDSDYRSASEVEFNSEVELIVVGKVPGREGVRTQIGSYGSREDAVVGWARSVPCDSAVVWVLPGNPNQTYLKPELWMVERANWRACKVLP